MSMKADLTRLRLLANGAHIPPEAHSLTALCDAGVLEGDGVRASTSNLAGEAFDLFCKCRA
jgi:hypothetical protein